MSQLLQITDPSAQPSGNAFLKENVVGIDLGTTHTLVSIVKDGKPIILGDHLIPSIVYAPADDQLIAGKAALEAAHNDEKTPRLLRSVKRYMGRETTGMPILAELELSPVEVSAAILREAKSHAEVILGAPVTQAVITIPAYFNGAQRQATKDAARLAGLEVVRLLSEPTAAALAYGLDQKVQGIYAVYDLGGGTFDFSLLRLERGVFQVLATHGDTHLGGDDVDQLILDHLSRVHNHTFDPSWLPRVRQLKEELTYVSNVEYQLDGCNGLLQADDVKKLIEKFLKRTLECVENALKDADKTTDQIDGVILAGGATRMPWIHRAVEEYFKQTPLMSMDPDHIVALGAAHQAYQLTHGSEHLLLDVTPLSLGVEMMGGVVERLIERNAPIPTQKTKKFTTAQDGQTGLILHIVQGEREFAADCRSLARLELKGIPPLKAGIAKIALTFTLDADGLLTVQAQEETTGITQEVMVKPTYGLSDQDMIEMLRKSYAVAEEDLNQRLLVESRLAGKSLLAVVMQALKEDGDILISTMSETILKAMDDLEAKMQTTDREAIESAIKHLNQVTHTFAEDRMGHRLSQALGGKNIRDVK